MFNETSPKVSGGDRTSDERTAEALAVVITKADGGWCDIHPSTVSAVSAFESQQTSEAVETASPLILDSVAKRSKPEYLGIIKGCPSGFISGHCDDGHRFAKEVYCGREWCPTCNGKWVEGKDMKPSHARRFSRWYEKATQISSMGYWTFTIPLELRAQFRTKKALTELGHDIQELLKSYGFNRGLRRWHFFGDNSTIYNPHLNCLVDGGLIGAKQLKAIRRAYSALLGVQLAIADYHYMRNTGQKVHALTYVTRATFIDAKWDIALALELRGFRNQLWWGSGLWNDGAKWSLDDTHNKTVSAMTSEQFHNVESLEHGYCPHDGFKIEWETFQPIGVLSEMHPVEEIGAGYYELPRSIPPSYHLDLSDLVPLDDNERGLSRLLQGATMSKELPEKLKEEKMRVRVRVVFPDHTVKNWFLSTESSASSYGKPVLVDEHNNPYGCADLPVGTVIRSQSKYLLYNEGARSAGYTIVDGK